MPTRSTPDWAAALARWAAGENGAALARELGVSYDALQRRAHKAGLRRRPGRPRVGDATEARIERLFRAGRPYVEIAAAVGVTLGTVTVVVKRRCACGGIIAPGVAHRCDYYQGEAA